MNICDGNDEPLVVKNIECDGNDKYVTIVISVCDSNDECVTVIIIAGLCELNSKPHNDYSM
jgi:hypothetical protein